MKPILELKDLSVTFHQHKKSVTLVDKVSFSVQAGECLGILGESGSGKSMTCKAAMGLLDKSFRITGQALFEGLDLLTLSRERMRRLRGKDICMILQNPMTCFDPLYRIGDQMTETFAEHTSLSDKEMRKKALETLELMQIKNSEDVLKKYPHQLSGGMLQRVMIGLALSTNPKLIIADEPTTAIDTITQYEILKEFLRIKNTCSCGMIFISHDLGVISKMADHVLVMHNTKAVQAGSLQDILNHPADAYTKTLVEKRMAVMQRFECIVGTEQGAAV